MSDELEDVEPAAVEEGVPPSPTPPAAPSQPGIPVEDLASALAGAYNKIVSGQRQAPAVGLDAMSAAEKEELNTLFLTDSVAAAKKVQERTRQEIYQQAMPMIQTAANQVVELFKLRKQRSDPYFNRVEPLFDKSLVGIDITPLVNMNEATRTQEMEMRWKMARADVLEEEVKRKPEPKLLSQGGGGGGKDRDGGKKDSLRDDPWLQAMKSEYGFTDEQLAEIEAAN